MQRSSGRVLVVEPDEETRERVIAALHEALIEADGSATGHQALLLANRRAYSVIVTELAVPGLGRLELYRRIRAHRRYGQAPILILSAERTELDRIVAFEVGVDDYVTKPFSVRELVLRVRGLLWRARNRPKRRTLRT